MEISSSRSFHPVDIRTSFPEVIVVLLGCEWDVELSQMCVKHTRCIRENIRIYIHIHGHFTHTDVLSQARSV